MTHSVRFAIALGLTLMFSASAQARCAVCNATVVLDDTLANCFVQRADALLTLMQASDQDVQWVDLSDCESRELPVGDPSAGSPTLDSAFMIDAANVVCLRDAIERNDRKTDNPQIFDLATLCR